MVSIAAPSKLHRALLARRVATDATGAAAGSGVRVEEREPGTVSNCPSAKPGRAEPSTIRPMPAPQRLPRKRFRRERVRVPDPGAALIRAVAGAAAEGGGAEEGMAQPSKEPCKKEACDIQACLSKNMFDSRKCVKVIQLLQSCCEQCEYKSTHCGSLSGLLKNISK